MRKICILVTILCIFSIAACTVAYGQNQPSVIPSQTPPNQNATNSGTQASDFWSILLDLIKKFFTDARIDIFLESVLIVGVGYLLKNYFNKKKRKKAIINKELSVILELLHDFVCDLKIRDTHLAITAFLEKVDSLENIRALIHSGYLDIVHFLDYLKKWDYTLPKQEAEKILIAKADSVYNSIHSKIANNNTINID